MSALPQFTHRFTLTVPRVPPSGNEMRRRYRTYFALRDLRLLWEKELMICVGGSGPLWALRDTVTRWKEEKRPIRVEVIVYRAKQLDVDNAMSGLKPVLDALKNLGFIWDDSPRGIELVGPRQIVSKRKDFRTVIYLD